MLKAQLPIVAIIDFGMGNLFSVRQACQHVGLCPVITSEKKQLLSADAVVLPGVGAFGDAMAKLKELDLIKPILDFIRGDKPFMGICLGMQLLMSESEEFGKYSGLNVFKGRVIKFPVKIDKDKIISKVPQVGWNKIYKPLHVNESFWCNSPLSGICGGEFMYFVHSYYCKVENNDVILSITRYADIDYCSSVSWKNVFACQFHPEKSATEGLKIYKQWSSVIKKMKGL